MDRVPPLVFEKVTSDERQLKRLLFRFIGKIIYGKIRNVLL